jgi:hypothetical protein
MRYTFMTLAVLSLYACAEFRTFNSTEKTQIQPNATDALPQPSVEADPVPIVVESVVESEIVLERCDSASLKTVTQKLNFPEQRGCSFGQGQNLPPVNKHLQAVETQTFDLQLPQGLLCDVAMTSPTEAPQLHYDDVMVLTMDNHVLLSSSSDLMHFLDAEDRVYTWDFKKIAGQESDFNSQPYCLNEALDACTLPISDTSGPMKINLDAVSIAPIAEKIEGKTSVPVSLHMLGDNDARDCYHTQLDLVLNIKYVSK